MTPGQYAIALGEVERAADAAHYGRAARLADSLALALDADGDHHEANRHRNRAAYWRGLTAPSKAPVVARAGGRLWRAAGGLLGGALVVALVVLG